MLIFCHSIWLIKLLCLETFLSHANCHVPRIFLWQKRRNVFKNDIHSQAKPIFCVYFIFLSFFFVFRFRYLVGSIAVKYKATVNYAKVSEYFTIENLIRKREIQQQQQKTKVKLWYRQCGKFNDFDLEKGTNK